MNAWEDASVLQTDQAMQNLEPEDRWDVTADRDNRPKRGLGQVRGLTAGAPRNSDRSIYDLSHRSTRSSRSRSMSALSSSQLRSASDTRGPCRAASSRMRSAARLAFSRSNAAIGVIRATGRPFLVTTKLSPF